ncbi:uncharacterized protein HMPREF1541_08939 [Cyphellophora europaea CBS 101466]|uniref:Orc1-like AAA ATPase domain-containing protein n=1 Tax=Cyphellophora europaea (strain CBS 101466) TaxID=1220924 RepID=W2RJK1_CYPE1|nr:uncharacterized protein HMPREF1541_08939 [Cyphellophora europaea CBS 101466]ETN36661.1 hypothetical protein HMPREF1541_08939 [Cyphellophora europaea CBS 101466]
MVATLPLEVLQIVAQTCPCREPQINDIATLFNGVFPPPPTVVAYGLQGSSKLEVITAVLNAHKLKHAVIKCRECLSQRHLLGKIFAACAQALGQEEAVERYDRVDSLNALSVNLQKLFRGSNLRTVIVLDSIDELKGPGSTLLPALARLGDMISGLSLVLTTTSVRPLALHRPGVPHIYFPAYTRSQAIHILCLEPPALPDSVAQGSRIEDLASIYKQFAITVYDALIAPTTTSLATLRKVTHRLWPRFIWPAVSGEAPPGKTKSWDFPRLLVRGRALFHSEGESALLDTLQSTDQAWTFDELLRQHKQGPPQPEPNSNSTLSRRSNAAPTLISDSTLTHSAKPLLTPLATLLLLASHLASHTPPKHDILLFSRLSATSSKHRKIRYIKRGNPGSGTTPKKANADNRRKDKTKSLAPKAFSMERLLAVARAVHPEGVGGGMLAGKGKAAMGGGAEGWSDRVAQAMGELERMRLVRREDDGHEDGGGGKWRVNVGREVVVEMSAQRGLGVQEWELDL